MRLLTGSQLVAESMLRRMNRLLCGQQHLTPREWARLLMRQKVLSPWQSAQLLAGRQAFYVGDFKIFERRQDDSELISFVAEDIRSQRLVTCLVDVRFEVDDVDRQAFRRTFSWWEEQRHPNLIALRELQSGQGDETTLVAAIDYEEGPTLSEVIRARGPLPWRQAARLAAQFAAMLQQVQPVWLSPPVGLSEFHLGQGGQLRWNPLRSMLRSIRAVPSVDVCRWGQQTGLFFLMLISDADAIEWLLRFQRRRAVMLTSYAAWKKLPLEARQMIEPIVTTKAGGLARATAWFREQSVPVQGAMELVPARLHRHQLHTLLRRTPHPGTSSLPVCTWNDLLHVHNSLALSSEAGSPEDMPVAHRLIEPDRELLSSTTAESLHQPQVSRGNRFVLRDARWRVSRRQVLMRHHLSTWIALMGLLLAMSLGAWLEHCIAGAEHSTSGKLSMSILGDDRVEPRKSLLI